MGEGALEEREWMTRGRTAAPDAKTAPAAALYVVATPLGHLRDVTLRALDVLAAADVIFAEDTRVSAVLLQRHGITTRPKALHAHNEARRAGDVVAELAAGHNVALLTDAGTPGISDPGARVVRTVRDAGYPVIPVPGPSAVAAAISVAGLLADQFLFIGFLPAQQKARAERLAAFATLPVALVFYEAPHRVRKTVTEMAGTLGPGRTLMIARELTKAFETIATMPLADAPAWIAADSNRERGEFVLIVDAPPPAAPVTLVDAQAQAWLAALVAELPPARAAQLVAKMTGAPREALYRAAIALKDAGRAP
jgi:16S rRNA (cytidine1402-2'-O)-methyltransferase